MKLSLETPPAVFLAAIAMAVIVGAVASVAYLGALEAGWAWDDFKAIGEQMPEFRTVESAFLPPEDVPRMMSQYYRPAVVLTWLMDRSSAERRAAIDGVELEAELPRVFHRTNVGLHALVSALLAGFAFLLSRAAGFKPLRALAVGGASGLLFALHPAHVESVTWASGRSDLMMSAFLLASLIAFSHHLRSGSWLALAGSAVFFAGALLSKEPAVAVLPLFGVLALSLPRHDESGPPSFRRLWAALPAALVTMAYLVARVSIRGDESMPGVSPATDGILDAFRAVGWYLGKAIWPHELTVHLDRLSGSGILVLGLLTGVACVLFFLRLPLWRKLVPESVGAALFVLPILPTLIILINRTQGVAAAERYVYLPSAGIILLACVGISRAGVLIASRGPAGKSKGALRVSVLPIALPLILAAVLALPAWSAVQTRVDVWSSDLSLWTYAVEKNPGLTLTQFNLGVALYRSGNPEEAITWFRSSLTSPKARLSAKARSADALIRSQLGSALLAVGKVDEAIDALENSTRLDPSVALTQYNLGHALTRKAASIRDPAQRSEWLRRSLPHFEAALRSDPDYVLAHFHYGDILAEVGEPERGLEHLREGLRLDPDHPQADLARRALRRREAR